MIDTPETQHDISIEELEEVDPKVLFSNLQQSTKLLIKSQMMRKQMISTIFSLKPTQTLMLFVIQHKISLRTNKKFVHTSNLSSNVKQQFLLHRWSQVIDKETRNDAANTHQEIITRSLKGTRMHFWTTSLK